MGYREDQDLPSKRTATSDDDPPPPAYAPPLPPREPEVSEAGARNPHPSDNDAKRNSSLWTSQDPRAASTDSLVPQQSIGSRRTLLLIYIHGFLGDETTFRSFPAHVHNFATHLLSKSHVVHTKIYPKYKSRRAIEFARDAFSEWLKPHESSNTDVILLGHSMGGLLSAEVCLKKANPASGSVVLQHRILGAINFDVPFLGMHPGVVVSGIGSLFRPTQLSPSLEQHNALLPVLESEHELGVSPSNAPLLQQRERSTEAGQDCPSYFPPNASSSFSNNYHRVATGDSSSHATPLSIPVGDSNYNPRFDNDVIIPMRKGWESALYFVTKHAGGLTQATKTYVTSHLEFGGAMADFKSLHERYIKIRSLEDIDDLGPSGAAQGRPTKRVRFINYYTASTGRLHPPKPLPPEVDAQSNLRGRGASVERGSQELGVEQDMRFIRSRPESPKVSVEDPEGNVMLESFGVENPSLDEDNLEDTIDAVDDLDQVEPKAMSEDERDASREDEEATNMKPLEASTTDLHTVSTDTQSKDDQLPPIPPEPTAPDKIDLLTFSNKEVQKLHEKDYERKMKAHKQAVKDREKAIAERQKILDRREKKVKKEQEKALKADKKATEKAEKQKAKQEAAAAKAAKSSTEQGKKVKSEENGTDESKAHREKKDKDKPKKDRKFCITPSKGPNGERDPTWIRVYMEGVDEVGAHCGIFFDDKPHYEKFVNDVGAKIEEWIDRDLFVHERVHEIALRDIA